MDISEHSQWAEARRKEVEAQIEHTPLKRATHDEITLGQLHRWAENSGLDLDKVIIEYAGCGSHMVLVSWEDA